MDSGALLVGLPVGTVGREGMVQDKKRRKKGRNRQKRGEER